jgi:hypothetical protein
MLFVFEQVGVGGCFLCGLSPVHSPETTSVLWEVGVVAVARQIEG